MLRRYVEAVTEFHIHDINDGIDLLLSGKWPGYDGRFAPTPPQLASASRKCRDKRLDAAALEKRLRPALPPPDIVHTDEQRAKAKAQVQAFIEGQAAANVHQTTEEAKRHRERWEKVNSRFQPAMDDASIMERLLGYSSGSPESDEFAA